MKKFLSVLMTGVCVIACTFSLSACGGTPEEPAHTHDYKWVDNGDGTHKQHCQSSGCDAPDINKGNHDFTNGDCVCGAKKPHTHNWSLTYTEEGDRHYQTCDGCEEKKYGDHDYGTDGVCVCGKEKPVTTVAVTGVTLDKDSITLETGGTETLTATVAPENATNKTVTWTVEPAGVVNVENGEVTALAAGTATITATADGKSATCTVTVNAPLTNAEVLNVLNEKVTIEAAKNIFPSWDVNEINVKETTWYVTKEGDNVTEANLVFTYLRRADTNYITLCKVDFASPLTPQSIKDGEVGTPTYTEIYRKGIDPQIQAEHTTLTNAICDKLFGVNETATRYIINDGFVAVDPQLGDMSTFTVIEITDTGIKAEGICIAYSQTDDGLIAKLSSEANYRTYDNISHAITGTKLLNNSEAF